METPKPTTSATSPMFEEPMESVELDDNIESLFRDDVLTSSGVTKIADSLAGLGKTLEHIEEVTTDQENENAGEQAPKQSRGKADSMDEDTETSKNPAPTPTEDQVEELLKKQREQLKRKKG